MPNHILVPRQSIRRHVLLVAMITLLCGATAFAQSPGARTDFEKVNPDLVVLASKLATPNLGASEEWRNGVIHSYEDVYGSSKLVPGTWQALVRRTLTCHAVNDFDCIKTSMEEIEKLGGVSRLPLKKLYEVVRFKTDVASIATRLEDAKHDADIQSRVPETIQAPIVEQPLEKPLPVAAMVAPIPPQPAAVVLAKAPQQLVGLDVALGSTLLWPAPPALIIFLIVIMTGLAVWLIYVAIKVRSRRMAKRTAENIAQSVAEIQQEPEPVPTDPAQLSARRLLDALHAAERDVEPFLKMVCANEDEVPAASVATLKSWHQSIQEGRNSMLDSFEKRAWPTELSATVKPAHAGEAMERLVKHAAFFIALLQLQNKRDSSVFHWSRLLPGAVMQLYWSHQTKAYTGNLIGLPMPDMPISRAPLTLNDSANKPNDFFAKAVQQANQRK